MRYSPKLWLPDSFIDATMLFYVKIRLRSLNELMITVVHLKLLLSHVDVMPPKFLCEVIDVTAPRLLSVSTSSLSSGCVPEYAKTVCVQPLIKKIQPQSIRMQQLQTNFKITFFAKVFKKSVSTTAPQNIDTKQHLGKNSVQNADSISGSQVYTETNFTLYVVYVCVPSWPHYSQA